MPTTHHPHHTDTRHRDGSRRVVQHGRASTTSSIAQAIVIKNDELFFLCNPNGDVPHEDTHGLGLYYHDCRYLGGYELRVGGQVADRLAADASRGFWATIELTNPDLTSPDGELIEKERVGIKWERTLDADTRTLHETLALTNFGVGGVRVPVTIRLWAGFESLFEVRGAQPKQRGTVHPPRYTTDGVEFRYDGADGITRRLTAAFDPPPTSHEETTASFDIAIDPHDTATISVWLQIHESDSRRSTGAPARRPTADARDAAQASSDRWMRSVTRVHTGHPLFDNVLHRSLRDLHLLRTTLQGRRYFAAGVPWYVTLFGRDSIIAAMEALAFMPDAAEDTVRLLASYQGTHDDAWRDEGAGKIMHELRVGEMARLNEIPQTPYYGSIDATPLFLILLSRHAAWTGRLDVFHDLKPHVEGALNWIDDAIDRGGIGYLAYATASSKGLANQGWKDSGDSIVNHDGSLAEPPIALVEVQAYVYLAKQSIAELYRRAGDESTADRLTNEAEALCQRFERDFWIDEIGTYALALQKDRRPAAVVTSNAGQALWTGIASPERAIATARRLLQDDLFSGWGIRTLSSRERRYNPIGYHDGTVWPHDNAIVLSGLQRYGCVEEAARIVSGITAAAAHFDHFRLPEVFAGFSRAEFAVPVHYPVACHPQAWAAGAVPFMLESLLGLRPDAFNRRLSISSPTLPPSVDRVSIDGLRVGDASVRIVFARRGADRAIVDDVHVDGSLEVASD